MSSFQFKVTNGELFIKAAQDAEPQLVSKIETMSKTYVTHISAIGDSIRNGIPYLKPNGNCSTYGKARITGIVFGHPEREDGERIDTSDIKTFHLEDGSILDTQLGRLERDQGTSFRGIADALINASHGRDYNL